MMIGENIRRARQKRGMTQWDLAQQLGVSDRAVSRWENDAAAPDVALLAQLALVLDTSADALLGVDPQRMQEEVLRATAEANRLVKAGLAEEAVRMLRAKAEKYPNQPELMVYLALALLEMRTEAAAREAYSLCRAADGRSMRLSTTFGCKQTMAFALHHLGRAEEAARLVEDEMPAIFVSRELLLPRVAPPERAMKIRRSNVDLLSNLLVNTLHKLQYEEAAQSVRTMLQSLPAPD